MEQLDRIAAGVRSPCRLLKLADCGHAPQRDQPQAVIEAIEALYRGTVRSTAARATDGCLRAASRRNRDRRRRWLPSSAPRDEVALAAEMKTAPGGAVSSHAGSTSATDRRDRALGQKLPGRVSRMERIPEQESVLNRGVRRAQDLRSSSPWPGRSRAASRWRSRTPTDLPRPGSASAEHVDQVDVQSRRHRPARC